MIRRQDEMDESEGEGKVENMRRSPYQIIQRNNTDREL